MEVDGLSHIPPHIRSDQIQEAAGDLIPSDEIAEPKISRATIIKKKFISGIDKAAMQVPRLLRAMAAGVLSVKTSMAGGQLSGAKEMAAGLQGAGGVLIGLNVPFAVLSTYSLVKDWSQLSWKERIPRLGMTAAPYVLLGSGIATVVKALKASSSTISSKATIAMKVLGPVGLGLLSLANVIFTIRDSAAAVKIKQKIGLLNKVESAEQQGPAEALLEYEQFRLKKERRDKIFGAIKSALLAVGLGLGAVIAAGVAISPIGWVAVGLIASSIAIGIGVYAYRRFKERGEASEVQEKLITSLNITSTEDLEQELNAKLDLDSSWSEFLKEGKADFVKKLLDSPPLHGMPTLREAILNSAEQNNEPD